MLTAGARCAVHVDQPAVDTCTRCGNFCCIGCYESDDGLSYCRPCYEKVSVKGENSSRATTAMVLSLLALLIYCLPLAIPGVILGHMELNAIKAGEAPASGRNLATGAVVLGYIVIALSVVGLVVLLALMLGTATSGSSF